MLLLLRLVAAGVFHVTGDGEAYPRWGSNGDAARWGNSGNIGERHHNADFMAC